jgi:MOSC domain-containing protein
MCSRAGTRLPAVVFPQCSLACHAAAWSQRAVFGSGSASALARKTAAIPSDTYRGMTYARAFLGQGSSEEDVTIAEHADSQAPVQPIRAGAVAELWRYPVKSMLGERVSELVITRGGAVGDRAWALREPTSGRIASAKKYPLLLAFRAGYETEPTPDAPGRIKIEGPDGSRFMPDDEEASAIVSEVVGARLEFESQAGADERTEIDPQTVFGDIPVGDLKPEWTPETMPDYFQLMSGSFLEIGPLFLVTSGSIDHLRMLQGGTARIDRRRFRPNIYVDSVGAGGGFVEDGWLGKTLTLGRQVELDQLQPTLWCVTSTLAQEDLPRDLSILRTAAQHHKGCLGVYASVRAAGVVRVNDAITLR